MRSDSDREFRDRLEVIAGAVADGEDVDWRDVEASTPLGQRVVVDADRRICPPQKRLWEHRTVIESTLDL